MEKNMKIVHITPSAPYNDYWGYQDNLLPKYHKKLGHDVSVITTNTQHKDEKIIEISCGDYTLDDGVRVIRRARKKYFHPTISGLNSKLEIYDILKELHPDFIFFHGLVSHSIDDVIKYKKENPSCIVVQDNHMDYINHIRNSTIKDKIVRTYYRLHNQQSIKYVEKVYGVTPWRKQYAEDYFKIPKSKTDVLIMGADDEKIDFEHKVKIRSSLREKHGITSDDFLIVTGGKIDEKKNIHLLMQACSEMKNVKLLIFGNVADDFKNVFETFLKSDNIIYIGWIASDEVYNYFFASDLVFFPGQHSVLWEQACAAKVPCVFKRFPGMEHVNNGGNSDFIDVITVESLKNEIQELHFTEKYYKMKTVAESEKTDIYLYSNIAWKSLECVRESELSLATNQK